MHTDVSSLYSLFHFAVLLWFFSQSVEKRTEVNSDLKEEVQQTLEILKKLDKPAAPTVEGQYNLNVCILE